MSFLIDGYNFLFRIEGIKKGSFEKKRHHFIDILNQELSCFKATVLIIFDSSEQIFNYAQCTHFSHLQVLYAPKGLSADEYIIELIEISKTPKTLTVVTSDTGLARISQHLGARTISIEDFLVLIMQKAAKRQGNTPCYRESPSEIQRLLKAFERKLQND